MRKGTNCTPVGANILMANFESKYICLYIKDKTKIFLRFIDDLFMIWTDSEQELLDFLSDLNKNYPSIKLKFTYSQTKQEFEDALIYKVQNDMLQTTISRKQKNRKKYLDS